MTLDEIIKQLNTIAYQLEKLEIACRDNNYGCTDSALEVAALSTHLAIDMLSVMKIKE